MAISKKNRREIFVYAHWALLDKPRLMGMLYSEVIRGKEVFSFEYANDWLKSGKAQLLDPDLQLFSGTQYLADEKPNFGLFLDSSPDRWGRLLMKRREAAYARSEQRPEKHLSETDYLLGVFDDYRMGALRFKEDAKGNFLNDDNDLAAPPRTSLRTIEEISLKLEDDNAIDDPDYIKWLNMLLHPGSSLGGARPKASIVDNNEHLWIAKFPSIMDAYNIGGWEMLANKLAVMAGLNVATCDIQQFSGKHYTFMTKRFDRMPNGERIHFASAMTLLAYNDGDNFQDGASYLELADFIIKYGADVSSDLEELWRRIVFSIAISNTDDHLRNHGFLLTPNGWRLSPAYDINPVANSTGLKLNISESDNALYIGLALEVKDFFRLSDERADAIIIQVKNAVNKWKNIANTLNLPRNEQESMKGAFLWGSK
jgi:serine/threonine-protein kinase HipA